TELVDVIEGMVSGYSATTLGSQTVTMSYGGKSVSVDVTVRDYVTSINITAEPTKKLYYIGDALDLTGMVVESMYASGAKAILTEEDYSVSGFDNSKEEIEQLITISYIDGDGTYTASLNIRVTADTIDSIIVSVKPDKLIYYITEDTALDLTGGKITVKWAGAGDVPVDLTDSLILVSGFDMDTAGTKSITLSYGGKSTSFTIEVKYRTYKVEFSTSGGSTIPEQVVNKNGTVTLPVAPPTKGGYTFEHWYLDDPAIDFDFNTPIVADIILNAKWAPVIASVASVSAVNGKTTVILAAQPAVAPALSDFTLMVYKDGDTTGSAITPASLVYDGNKTVSINFAAIAQTSSTQSIVIGVSLSGGVELKTAPYTISATSSGGEVPGGGDIPGGGGTPGGGDIPGGGGTPGTGGTPGGTGGDDKKPDEKPEDKPEDGKEDEKPAIGSKTVNLPDGTTANIITKDDFKELISDIGQGGTIEIDMSRIGKSNSIILSLPSIEPEGKKDSTLIVTTSTGQVTIDIDKLLQSGLGNKTDAEIIISPETGTAEIFVGGKKLDLPAFDNPISISMGYAVKPVQNTDYLVAYWEDENGNRTILPMSYFENGAMNFSPPSSGRVGVMHNEVMFEDTLDRWMDDDVCYLAARGIIKGTGGKNFSPDANINRADFVVLLVRMLGVSADTIENFDDVDSNAYYARELAIARALGIVNGIGGNKFNPNGEISRQDAFVMLYRAMKKYSRLPDSISNSNPEFKDFGDVSDYALESIESFTKSGIVKGSGGYLNPKDTTTRGEAAALFRRIIKYFMK
ncbi:MAG TPA: S-layer homology domain-containing protein, partial [Clostridiales bacterium]|nr:S-layer homology domain-containing protein [Clostridiales bacterium]